MRIYCTTFSASSDWLATAGNWEQMDAYATCSRPYIIMETVEYDQIVAAAQSGGSGSPPASAPVYSLSVADGAELAWLIGGAWALAYAARLVIAPIRTALFSPGDGS